MGANSTGELFHLPTARIRQSSFYSRRSFPASVAMMNSYEDDGHLGYYGKINCGLKKEEKKRMKIVKGLERDLKCLNMQLEHSDNGSVGEVKEQVISEAAEQLLSYLTKLREEAKDHKRQRKQEKAKLKAEKKATKAKTCMEISSSSSSSSESSDSECETKVLKASTLKKTEPVTTAAALQTVNAPEEAKGIKGTQVLRAMEKIEVCMGGKCKKAGADELKMEFEKMVGEEGVVGCKCMGKCRDGPNVRVRNESIEDGLLRVSKGPLCMGVGLEDVGSIVSNFLQENPNVEVPWTTAA